MSATEMSPAVVAGLQLFARYAYPPNRRGFCGPADHVQLGEYAQAGVADPGLAELARGFLGPWPYLTLIAGAANIADPFDYRVVEAYWVGNELLERVPTHDFGNRLEEAFKGKTGAKGWNYLAETIPGDALCHHSYHVFGVYPWAGLLRRGHIDQPLQVLQQCRIRWGRVAAVQGTQVFVDAPPLEWTGQRIRLGEPQRETVSRSLRGPLADLVAGEWVSMHWDWLCDRLSSRQVGNLRHYTLRQLALTNDQVAHSGPNMAMTGDVGQVERR
jgi:hypothetical protein